MNLTSKQVAVLLGLTERRIRQLADDGVAVRITHGQYDGAKTIQNYISSMTGPAKSRDEVLDEAKEAARLKKEQADNWELKTPSFATSYCPLTKLFVFGPSRSHTSRAGYFRWFLACARE